MSDSGAPLEAEGVLDFWFGPIDAQGLPAEARMRRWFSGGDVDAELRGRFGALHARAVEGACDGWTATPRGTLALVVVLDQLSRNLHRGTPAMYANDARALALAEDFVATARDRALRPIERVFAYMPFMHAEAVVPQERCVQLFAALVEEAAGRQRDAIAGNLAFAVQHRDIVVRFGRFPHRNAVLGRESTPAELAFLKLPGSGF